MTNRGIDYRPIIDTKGVDLLALEKNLSECKEFAAEIDPSSEMFAEAISGTIAGAAVGALVGASVGETSYGAQTGTKYGATAGTLHGYTGSINARQQIIRNCMVGRGYKILY